MTWLWQPLLPGAAQLLAGGGGGVEGEVAQTLGAVTQSSTGKLKIKATGSEALSAFTQSTTTGRLRIKGQV